MFKKISLSLLLLSIANTGWAGSYICSGLIDTMLVSRGGTVEIYSAQIYGNTVGRSICNLNTTWKTVAPETCKTWYSTLLAQSAQAKPAKIYYLTEEAATCPNILYYDNAAPPYGVAYAKD